MGDRLEGAGHSDIYRKSIVKDCHQCPKQFSFYMNKTLHTNYIIIHENYLQQKLSIFDRKITLVFPTGQLADLGFQNFGIFLVGNGIGMTDDTVDGIF